MSCCFLQALNELSKTFEHVIDGFGQRVNLVGHAAGLFKLHEGRKVALRDGRRGLREGLKIPSQVARVDEAQPEGDDRQQTREGDQGHAQSGALVERQVDGDVQHDGSHDRDGVADEDF